MKYFISATVLLGIPSWGVRAQQPLYAQCGGIGWSGATACVAGASCNKLNDYYSQCLPGAAAPSQTITASAPGGSSTPAPSGGITSFLGGVNMAGYDFSSKTDGSFENDSADPPTGQFSHFAAQGVNIFRIPFAWQLMTPTVGGTIDPQFFSRYDATVQTALRQSSSPFVILDVHNYARWNGAIIAQGGPTNEQFASLWSQLAAKYKDNSKIIFGIMNEPHDVPSIPTWVTSVQAAVNAIRATGATSQFILIPGSSWSSAEALPTEAGPALLGVTDPIGDKYKIIFDVHKYLDFDNSGTHTECSTNNIQVLTNLVTFLQNNGNRQALLSETGGGNTASCETAVNEELAFVKSHFPTLAGFTVWSAGSFDTSYELTVTPNPDGSDQPVWVAGVRPNLP